MFTNHTCGDFSSCFQFLGVSSTTFEENGLAPHAVPTRESISSAAGSRCNTLFTLFIPARRKDLDFTPRGSCLF